MSKEGLKVCSDDNLSDKFYKALLLDKTKLTLFKRIFI